MPTLNKFFLAAIILGIILSATSVLYGNITFHVDIARDFLLLQELVDKGDFSLIGPRAAGIDGLFHGPLWMYLNAPAYYVGGGNPVVVGWFWILLSIITICSIYWVGKKLYGKTEGLAAAALFFNNFLRCKPRII
jgi:4-amino-4-deoxy-L-arabinose transferase-like glycosyltransferase